MHASLINSLAGLAILAQPTLTDPHSHSAPTDHTPPAAINVPAPEPAATTDPHSHQPAHTQPAYPQEQSGTATIMNAPPRPISEPANAHWNAQDDAAQYQYSAQAPVPGYWQPGGYEGRFGSPYYYSVPGGYGQYGGPSYAESPPEPIYNNYGAANGAYWNPDVAGDVYSTHFGPGYYRHAEYGHDRFPYYNYRAPWYHPGPPTWNRDTNRPW